MRLGLCIGYMIPTWGHLSLANVGRSWAAGAFALWHCYVILSSALLIFFNAAAALLRCYIQWFSGISMNLHGWRYCCWARLRLQTSESAKFPPAFQFHFPCPWLTSPEYDSRVSLIENLQWYTCKEQSRKTRALRLQLWFSHDHLLFLDLGQVLPAAASQQRHPSFRLPSVQRCVATGYLWSLQVADPVGLCCCLEPGLESPSFLIGKIMTSDIISCDIKSPIVGF